MNELWSNFFSLYAAAAPWLIIGLIVSGLLKAWIPSDVMSKHLGKPGFTSVIKASFIGAPLPLCSCGVIPAALGLRKAGASKSSTVSFLVATPETGVDSIAISYALLGPVMAIVRPVAAIMSAIIAGLFTTFSEKSDQPDNADIETSSCCEKKQAPVDTCCAGTQNKNKETPVDTTISIASFQQNTVYGLRYSFTKILDEIIVWLLIGIVFATLVQTFIDPGTLSTFGSGLPAMIVMVLIGIPMYICATASTPIAAGLMLSGISPGTVLVFLLAGPATNMATLGMVKQSMGRNTLIAYLSGVVLCSIGFGLGLDYIAEQNNLNIAAQIQHQEHVLPQWLTNLAVAVFTMLMLNSLIGKYRLRGSQA